MDGKSRVFRPEVEKVWHEDYQCEYYRGVIIDGEDNIVERCAKMHPNYTAAFSDAVEKETSSVFLSRKGHPILGEILSRKGESDCAFYSSRIKNEYDIETLPGHKDIWKILSVANISKNKNVDSEVTINYLEFSNLTKDFKKREKTKTIVIKRKWDFYNELMDFLVEM